MYWTGIGSDPLAETDLAGNVLENYIFVNGQRIARRDASTKAVHYYFSDHLGTHSLITDANGDMPPQEESDYYPFGSEIPASGSDPNHYKFTGKERDSESTLDYFGARHYASGMGRFVRPDEPFADQDTSDPQTWNMYAYAVNNPLRFTDPSGMAHNDPNGYWVGDYNGECGQQNGTTMCWNASAANGNGEWQAPPQPSEIEIMADMVPGGRSKLAFDSWARRANPIIGGYIFVFSVVKFSAPEQEIADALEAEGMEVAPLGVVQGQKNPDALVNGVKTEFETVTVAGTNTLKNRIQEGLKQASDVVVDTRQTAITKAEAVAQIKRVEGNLGTNLQGPVTVVTREGILRY